MRLVIDWHNLGFTMLSLRLGDSHPAVWAARAYEAFFARRAHGHMCVTRAMAGWLRDNFSIGEVNNGESGCIGLIAPVKLRGSDTRLTHARMSHTQPQTAPLAVLYDRPPEFFRKLEVAEAHALFARLQADTGPLAAAAADVFPSEFGAEAGGGWTLADASEQAATMITETVAVRPLAFISLLSSSHPPLLFLFLRFPFAQHHSTPHEQTNANPFLNPDSPTTHHPSTSREDALRFAVTAQH